MKFKSSYSFIVSTILTLFIFFSLASCVPEKILKSEKQEKKRWLFDGSSLDDWTPTDFAGKGEIIIDANGSLVLEMGDELSGVHWKGAPLPVQNYEIHLKAKRTMGSDFFCGLTFPYKESHATLILGGWGVSLIGISSIDDFDASENETGDAYIFENNQWYKIKLKVSPESSSVWIVQDKVIDCDFEGREVGMRFGEIEMSIPLGICSYATSSEIRNIKLIELE